MKTNIALILSLILLSSCTIGAGDTASQSTGTKIQLESEQQPTSIPNSLTNE